jgi:hypothetical protein
MCATGIPEREVRQNEEETIFERTVVETYKQSNRNSKLQIQDTLQTSSKIKNKKKKKMKHT